ncbi:MAG: dienelactone hydrolase family protein [Bacteroidia bacterium]|nr:dienelactone hydrolase family protein [Bacteroidia bacterium]
MRWSEAILLAVTFLYAQIGHRTLTFNDPTRTGGFGSGGGPGRQIQTEIYYPATTSGTNAPIRSGIYPVVVIGHGFLMPWSEYQNLWEALVPYGYVVALPRTEGSFSPSHQDFALDLRVVAQRMVAEGQRSNSPFYQRIHPKVALMGHSMGGGCAVLAAQNFSDAHCVVGLAAANTNPSAITAASQVSLPVLMLAGSGDSVTPPHQHQLPIYNALASPCKWYVSLIGGGHCYFANNSPTCSFGENSAGSTITLTRNEQQALTNTLIRPFLDAYLKDSCLGRFLDTLSALGGITFQQRCTYQRLSLSGQVTHPTTANLSGGSIVLSVSGGTPPYTFVWSHGYTGPNPTGLSAGTYTVQVRDRSGCIAETTFVLSLVTAFLEVPSPQVYVRWDASQRSIQVEAPAWYQGLHWQLISTLGGEVAAGCLETIPFQISLASLPSGIYQLLIGNQRFKIAHLP